MRAPRELRQRNQPKPLPLNKFTDNLCGRVDVLVFLALLNFQFFIILMQNKKPEEGDPFFGLFFVPLKRVLGLGG